MESIEVLSQKFIEAVYHLEWCMPIMDIEWQIARAKEIENLGQQICDIGKYCPIIKAETIKYCEEHDEISEAYDSFKLLNKQIKKELKKL